VNEPITQARHYKKATITDATQNKRWPGTESTLDCFLRYVSAQTDRQSRAGDGRKGFRNYPQNHSPFFTLTGFVATICSKGPCC
jgi:hypothetical protein